MDRMNGRVRMISEKHKSLEAEARLNDCAVRKTSTHIGWFKTPTIGMVFEYTSIFTIEIHKLSSTVSGIHHGCLYVVVVRVTPPHGVDVSGPTLRRHLGMVERAAGEWASVLVRASFRQVPVVAVPNQVDGKRIFLEPRS